MLSAPALKSRLQIPDIFIYYLPFATFFIITICLHLTKNNGFLIRNYFGLRIFFIFLAALFSFMVGGLQQLGLLLIIAANCCLALSIVLYPWDEKDFHYLFASLALIACVLATHTILFYGSNYDIDNLTADQRKGYVTVGVATGFGCISALYLIFNKVTPLRIAILLLCWVGLALARARGALGFCILVSFAYYLYMLGQSRLSISRRNKIFSILALMALVPVVISFFLSLDQNRGRWTRLISDFNAELVDNGRHYLWTEALNKIYQSPLFGHGLGEYKTFWGDPHNLMLQFGVDGGIVAMALVGFTLFHVGSIGMSNFRGPSFGDNHKALTLFALFSYMVIEMMIAGDAYLGREWFIVSAFILAFASYRRIH